MSRSKFSPEEKLKAVNRYLSGEGSQEHIARLYGIDRSSFQAWIRNYKAMGADVFIRFGNKKYSRDLKLNAVQEYLSGQGSQDDICLKYGIRSKAELQAWIKEYNGHETLRSSGTGRSAFMTRGRKTTLEERIEIVQYCIAHDDNYTETAEKYDVSYQQARSYTIKYKDGGVEALQDRRGRRKDVDEMDELERLRAENKLLKAEKERAEMEVSFLKKLEEIERRRG